MPLPAARVPERAGTEAGSEITRPRLRLGAQTDFASFSASAPALSATSKGEHTAGSCDFVAHRMRSTQAEPVRAISRLPGFRSSAWTLPKNCGVKRIKKRGVFEPQASLPRFPLRPVIFRAPPKGAAASRSPSFGYFSWRDKKSNWPAGASPGKPPRRNKPFSKAITCRSLYIEFLKDTVSAQAHCCPE